MPKIEIASPTRACDEQADHWLRSSDKARQVFPGHFLIGEGSNDAGRFLAGFVTLAEDEHDVARAAAARAASMAARRARTDMTAGLSTPAMTSSMMLDGSSLRGLSEVTITRSAARSRLAHLRTFAPVAVPSRPDDGNHPSPGERPSSLDHGGDAFGGVGVVDHHRHRIGLPGDDFETPGHRRERGQALRRSSATAHAFEMSAAGCDQGIGEIETAREIAAERRTRRPEDGGESPFPGCRLRCRWRKRLRSIRL